MLPLFFHEIAAADFQLPFFIFADVETELEENETKLTKLQAELVQLSCEMLIHLRVIEDKSNFYRTCNLPDTWTSSETCTCDQGAMEPTCVQTGPSSARRDVSGNFYDY